MLCGCKFLDISQKIENWLTFYWDVTNRLTWTIFYSEEQEAQLSPRTTRCVMSIEILPIATQQCRNYLYDKSWPNRWYEVGDLVGGNAWLTMCTQPRRDRVGSHCLKCHKQTDDVELCISPVYRRLAVAKFLPRDAMIQAADCTELYVITVKPTQIDSTCTGSWVST